MIVKSKTLILFMLFAFFSTNYSTAQEVTEVLNRVEQKINSTNSLSFHSEYININPMVKDSISKSSATVWLERVPSDSIFGAHFHLQGKDDQEKVEYFYDGQNSYEIWHKDKKVTIFHPHDHPNTPNNPAKARTALSAFNQILINPNFKNTILEDHSTTSLKQSKNDSRWIVTIAYPENNHGQKVTKTLVINKNTYLIDRINQTMNWRGATFKTKYNFSNYNRNNNSISEKIYISKNFNGYTQEVHQRNSDNSADPYAKFIGSSAPAFSYRSISGKEISLNKLKGKFILLDFWESWCGYCILAMPKLNELQKKWQDNLQIVGVITENRNQIEELIDDNNLEYPNIYAERSILNKYKVTNRPTYFLINKEGRVASVSIGGLSDIEERINELVN